MTLSGDFGVPETVVADTGTILHLVEIKRPDSLCLFDVVTISQYVYAELRRMKALQPASRALAGQLKATHVTYEQIKLQAEQLSAFKLHDPDLSTAALAQSIVPDVVLTDDLSLRKALESQGWTVVGTIGVIIRAYTTGRIPKSEMLDAVDHLLDNSSLYTSKAFRFYVRNRIEEIEGQDER